MKSTATSVTFSAQATLNFDGRWRTGSCSASIWLPWVPWRRPEDDMDEEGRLKMRKEEEEERPEVEGAAWRR
jgi:hypothetical protein